MSKQHKIRWRESDLKELNRVVRNFNSKLARLEKKNPENAKYLPKFSKTTYDEYGNKMVEFTDRLSVNQLKELITTRRDLNREINALKRFSRRGAEEIITIPDTDYNIKVTKWQKTEMTRRVAIINRKRAARLEDISNTMVTDRGKETGYTRGDIGMGKIELNEVSKMNAFTPKMTQSDLKWKFKSIMSESQTDYFTDKDERLRQNYIKGIKEHYNYNDVKDIIEHIESMDMGEFLKIYYAEDISMEIGSPVGISKNLKKSSQQEYQQELYKGYENALRSAWLPK